VPPSGGGYGAPPPGAPGGAYGQPPPQQPAPAAPPPKKSKAKGCILAGCGGCLLVLLVMCGIGGYGLYLEEGYSYSDIGEEVQSIPIMAGVPFTMTHTWDGMGYAHHDFWLEVTGAADMGRFEITGQMGCDKYGEPYMREVVAGLDDYRVQRRVDNPDGTFTAWIAVFDEYDRSSSLPITCSGMLNPSAGTMSTGRLVLTRKQRPSDMFSF
jgi:hypothetical protein